MNRIPKASGLTLFALLLLTAPVAAQANVAGKWTLLLESPQGIAEISATLEQDGTTVTGVLELPDVEAVAMSNGMIEENKLTFILTMSFQGQEIAMEVTADLYHLARIGVLVPHVHCGHAAFDPREKLQLV
ncbi:MAG: hypothetical protein IH921_02245 [Gemmatimonadetes bacterium]|nr:hypothetical protein [Gemmatimonadota bacterium]